MVLEATIIVVDNSEHSRNGDYLPTRFEAQVDAVNLIFSAKTQSNPESSVGLMSMGGSQPEVLTTLTTDFGKILDGLHRTKIRGSSHLSTALNVAGLALKHRQNKSQHQRIILFACSPIAEDEKAIARLAKRLKKNTINVDIVAFGDLPADDVKKFEVFHENIKGSGDGSHLALIAPGPNLLSDSIVETPILAADGVSSGAAGAGRGRSGAGNGAGDGMDWEVDESVDPELAMVLRMSLMEEEERKRKEEREKAEKEAKKELDAVPEGAENGEGPSETTPLLEDNAASKKDPESEGGSGGGSAPTNDTDKMDTA